MSDQRVAAALKELTALKRLKNEIESFSPRDSRSDPEHYRRMNYLWSLKDEYRARKDPAWQEAFDAMAEWELHHHHEKD
jgi:hypothetical protein